MSLLDIVNPPKPTKRAGRRVSNLRVSPDEEDARKSKANAERSAERMRKLHADPEFEARRIAALRAAFAKKRANKD